ncbi:MAG TPA: hypothetical protein VED59_04175, partial [Acidimicrobiales bacterium]|nr:hypothetical protein [Acidimicrobiales bacterium]
MAARRARSYLDAVGVLISEAAILAFFLKTARLLGVVDLSHFGSWLRTTSSFTALTALLRLLGIVVFGWLLASTVLYGAATLSGKRRALRWSRLVTLPVLRRAMDAAAAASVVAASFGTGGTSALASSLPHRAPITQ